MKKVLLVVGVLVLLGLLFVSPYNKLVDLDEGTTNAWAKVQSAYQERNDLVGNLVATVKGAADFERATLTEVIEARSKATSIQVDANNLTPEAMQQFQQAQSGLTGALSRLMLTVERYPELKANQNFLMLQKQIEGIEHRIKTERNRYNDSVTAYNSKVRRFPSNITAMLFGFDRKTKFKSDEGAENATEIEFDFGK